MYRNVGGLIKGFATLICVLGILASVISGGFHASSAYKNEGITFLMIAGIGSLVSWLGSMALYGYGELIESSSQTRDYLKDVRELLKKMAENQGLPVDSYIDIPVNGKDAQEEYNEKVNELPSPNSRLTAFFERGKECGDSSSLLRLWYDLGLNEKPYSEMVEQYLNDAGRVMGAGETAIKSMLRWIKQTVADEEQMNETARPTTEVNQESFQTSGRTRRRKTQ